MGAGRAESPDGSGVETAGQEMSIIPSSAISAALTPVQRATHEAGRARQVQTDKNSHHAEDVEELDETAVNSVHDQGGGKGREKDGDAKKRKEGEMEEKVEIAALQSVPVVKRLESDEGAGGISHLDISA